MAVTRTAARDRPLARAVALAASAAVLYLLVSTHRVDFGWVPLLTGLGYLAGAVAGGPKGALWAPAMVVSGWGLANVLYVRAPFDELGAPESAAHMVGIGAGLLVLAGLHRLGVAASQTGIALSVLLSGVIFELQRGQGIGVLNQAAGYAAVLLVYAAAEVLTVGVRRR